MGANPFLGVFFHWLGGLASGSFYVPYKGVKKWSWETYWLVGGFFSWIICPWLLSSLLTHNVVGVLAQQSGSTLFWTYFFGAMWGFGGLTFGLTMRYLGMSLGMGVALGYCAAFGTLMPPIFKVFIPSVPVQETIVQIASTRPGQITLGGVAVCLLGIAIAALAGLTKEREMPEEQKKKAIAEFSFAKGILVATFSGIMSAGFSFALTAGGPIKADALKACFLHGAAERGIVAQDKGRLDPVAAEKLAAELAASSLSPKLGDKPTFGKIVEGIESGAVTSAELASQTSLAKDATAGRLIAYATGFDKVRGSPDLAVIVKDLKDFSLKEVAVGIALAGGDVIALHKKYDLWQGLPVLVVVLLGGFTTNFIWCVLLNLKNRSGYQYFSSHLRPEHASLVTGAEAPGSVAANAGAFAFVQAHLKIPVLANYLFSALAGTTWYFQFFFYQMGTTQMGKFDFASWTLHMASIIIFSTIWGWIFHEWKGASRKAHGLIAVGIATLILSTVVIGYGTLRNGGQTLHDVIKMVFG